MAVGVISTPATWYNGTVVQPSYEQNVEDTLNNTYQYKAKTRYMWLSPEMMRSTNGQWVYSTVSSAVGIWTATASSDVLICPIPIFYTNTGAQYQRITSVDVKLKPNSVATMACSVNRRSPMDTTNAPLVTAGSAWNSSGSGHQTVTIATFAQQFAYDFGYIDVAIVAGATGDIVYGVKLTFDNSTIVNP